MSSNSYSLSKINPKLLRRIYRACRPNLSEPNLALNLEICDYVNAKQGSAPREAAIAVVKLISQRDPQTSELAIALLDNLVKNCGYPFHLQISRKEFLNELVKRFPERPLARYSRVQRLILAQIEEWNQTICRTSKYKDDFGYIRDMRRLLSQKGYVFPEVKVEDAAVLTPSDNLQSLEELQKEEAIVHSAKLQELIRRGKPQDLQEANKLMKIMAGFKSDSIQESKKQILDDITRLKRKCEILNEMLDSVQSSGGKLDDTNEAAIELYSAIKASQPKITKIIEESDGEDVNDLLLLNDNVNNILTKFSLLKSGDSASAAQIKTSTASKEVNLIDFDDDEPLPQQEQSGYNDLLSDLSNLTFDGSQKNANTFGSGGSIALEALYQPKPSMPNANGGKTSADLDLLGLGSPSPQLQSNTGVSNTAAAAATTTTTNSSASLDPFGFDFPSSTPSSVSTPPAVNTPDTTSASKSVVILDSVSLKISLQIQNNTNFVGKATFTNPGSQPLNQFKFFMAVPKSCKLSLKPQSGDTLYPYNGGVITQEFEVENPANKALKIKWKSEYMQGGQKKEETGVSEL